MLGISWPIALACLGIWIAVAAVTRYSSLAALVATFLVPFFALWLATPRVAEFGAVLAVIIWLRHLTNIRRLLHGSETRIGDKSSTASAG